MFCFATFRIIGCASQAMSLDLYYFEASPPCRAVLMTAKELGIDVNIKVVNLFKGEHLSSDFVKMNPQHAVPVLVDNSNNLVLTESRAIMAYFVNRYSPGHDLYPSDAAERALIDRFLYFECGTIFPAQSACFQSLMTRHSIPEDIRKAYEDKLAILDSMMQGKKYLSGSRRSLADTSMRATLATSQLLSQIDLSKYPNIDSWYQMIQNELPVDEINHEGVKSLGEFLKSMKAASS